MTRKGIPPTFHAFLGQEQARTLWPCRQPCQTAMVRAGGAMVFQRPTCGRHSAGGQMQPGDRTVLAGNGDRCDRRGRPVLSLGFLAQHEV